MSKKITTVKLEQKTYKIISLLADIKMHTEAGTILNHMDLFDDIEQEIENSLNVEVLDE